MNIDSLDSAIEEFTNHLADFDHVIELIQGYFDFKQFNEKLNIGMTQEQLIAANFECSPALKKRIIAINNQYADDKSRNLAYQELATEFDVPTNAIDFTNQLIELEFVLNREIMTTKHLNIFINLDEKLHEIFSQIPVVQILLSLPEPEIQLQDFKAALEINKQKSLELKTKFSNNSITEKLICCINEHIPFRILEQYLSTNNKAKQELQKNKQSIRTIITTAREQKGEDWYVFMMEHLSDSFLNNYLTNIWH